MEKDAKPKGLCNETNEFLEEVYDEESCSGCGWESICREELGLEAIKELHLKKGGY